MATAGSLEESRSALALVRRHSHTAEQHGQPQLFSTVGVHPTRCGEFEQNAAGIGPDEYFAQLVAACEDGAREGKVRTVSALTATDHSGRWTRVRNAQFVII
jgi:TatD DNase family protein